jgi:ubiquinol-cytochrome c reductase iron-sulfur subunit
MSRPTPEAPPRAIDRRLFVGAVAAVCVGGKAARADQIDPQQIADFNEPVDVSRLAPGDWTIVLIDGEPVFVRRRTGAQIARARAETAAALPDPAKDEDRAPGDGQWLVVSGLCTHAGCNVVGGLGPYEGWMCLCHGSVYDLSGRVRHGPAKRNLAVVRHRMVEPGSMMLLSS